MGEATKIASGFPQLSVSESWLAFWSRKGWRRMWGINRGTHAKIPLFSSFVVYSLKKDSAGKFGAVF
jgi:hypothetical protein